MAKRKKETDDLEVKFSKLAGTVRKVNVKDFIKENYKPYIDYTILDRALVREDGLKPVQRRALWALWKMGLKSSAPNKAKAYEVYTYTSGNFHPHGATSVSSAMAKLGQWFTSRVLLIDVQGSVGKETGDAPAADRYYEIQLSKAGDLLLEDMKYNPVKMVPNYANIQGKEIPDMLPIKWPYAIINGGQGIAVGYATNMVPHNPTEVLKAVIERMKGNVKTTKKLLSIMKGPDMPTGGELIGQDGVIDYYETGKGTFSIRATYTIESLPRGRHAIIFDSLPYQIAPVTIQSQIKKVQEKKNKLKDITEVKNLTDMDYGVRFVVYVKAGANPNIVLEELFKETSLQNKYSVNNTIIRNNKPVKATMFELLDSFIEFRKECYINKVNYQVNNLELSIQKLSGLLKIIVDVDKAIEIIRNSNDVDEARTSLMKHFKVDEVGANYVLDMRLQKLTKQNSIELINQKEEFEKQRDLLLKKIENEDSLVNSIIEELKEVEKIIGDPRRTKVTGISNEDLEEEEKEARKIQRLLNKDVECKVLSLVNNTLIKSISDEYTSTVPVHNIINTTTKGKINCLLNDGTFSPVEVDSILLDNETSYSFLGISEQKMVTFIPETLAENQRIVVVTNLGNVALYKSILKSPLVKLLPGEKIKFAKLLNEEELDKDILIVARNGMAARFNLRKIREVHGGSGTIAGMKSDTIISHATLIDEFDIITTLSNKTIKCTEDNEVPSTNRGVKGSQLHKLDKDDFIISVVAKEEPLVYSLSINDNKNNYTLYNKPSPTVRNRKGTKKTNEEVLILI